jgi:hypothetical protein
VSAERLFAPGIASSRAGARRVTFPVTGNTDPAAGEQIILQREPDGSAIVLGDR